MKLFYNPASPFVRKVLVVASENNLLDRIVQQPIGLTPVKPVDSVNAENPLGKIPALVLDNGDSLYDSRVICEYLDSLGSAAMFPAAGDARWTALRRQSLADGMCDAAILGRYETFVKPVEKQWDVWLDGQKNKFRRGLDALEAEAASLGSQMDIGTASVAIALAYLDFRYADENWRDSHPQLAEWYQEFYQRDIFQTTIPADL